MHLLWFLGAHFAALTCLGKGVQDTHLGDCSDKGELPAPEILLSASEAEEGDWVSVQCVRPSDISVTMYFFCKDGEAKSAHKALPHKAEHTWTFQTSNQSAGQYSCGYKVKDNKNQEEKSALSAPSKLSVLPGNRAESDGNSSDKVLKLILPVVCFGILILAALVYFSVKKVASQRHSRDSLGQSAGLVLPCYLPPTGNNGGWEHIFEMPIEMDAWSNLLEREQAPVKDRSNLTSEENVHYANLVGLHHTRPLPFRNAETTYATIVPLMQQPGSHYDPASEPSWTEEDQMGHLGMPELNLESSV
ncbi:uncharacterized protein LOC143826365 [Paroedura picta]|uniref:uncharacterized protein LOC143826365 n=1 Tax=Paroedura picta TaxID=143630 RepID=UPI004055B8EC